MWIRGSSALTLSLLLLLSTLVGVAGHEHAVGIERAAVECTLDHEGAHGPQADVDGPELHASGERHQHHCPSCRHSGHRSSLSVPPAAVEPGPEVGSSSAFSSHPRVFEPTFSGTLRGPPAA